MADKVPIAVFVSGSGSNLEAILAVSASGFTAVEVVVVVSDKADAYGLLRAARRGVPTLAIRPQDFADRGAHERAILEALGPYAPRLAVLAGYMRLVTPVLLRHFYAEGRLGVVNIHPADTRAYQGVHGYEFAMGLLPQSPVRQGRTFITAHYVDEGMDTGPVIAQFEVDIHPDDTLEQLKERGLAVEHQVFPRVVDEVARGVVSLEGRGVVRGT